MLDIFKKFAARGTSRVPASRDVPDETELQIAVCALLLEMAHADDTFDRAEAQRISAVMQKNFGLSAETVREISTAAEQERSGSIDLWRFTNAIKTGFSAERKQDVIEMIWIVVYADGTLDQYEDHLVHKLAKLLGLDHEQLIEAKIRVKRQMT